MKTEKEEKESLEKIAEKVAEEFGEKMQLNISVRRKITKTPDFVMVYQKVAKNMLEGTLNLSTCKVFFYLMANMEFENFIGIDLKSISENISMSMPTLNRAMRDLKECGMIISIKDNFDARRNVYRLNPVIAWKGKIHSRTKALKANPNQTQMFGAAEDQIKIKPNETFLLEK